MFGSRWQSLILLQSAIIDMFKKRNSSAKTTNIASILVGIDTPALDPANLLAQPAPAANTRNNVLPMDEETQNPLQTGGVAEVMTSQKREIEQCFAELARLQREKELAQTDRGRDSDEENRHHYLPVHEEEPEHYSPQQIQQGHRGVDEPVIAQPLPTVHEVTIEDDEKQHIEVLEDYGEVSPEGSDSDDYEDGYENEIIKRTLSKHNYERMFKQLNVAHAHSKKTQALKGLDKISSAGLQRKIARDLRLKKDKRQELQSEVRFINSKIEQRHQQVKQKMGAQAQLEAELDRIRRMLEVVYYFGNELEELDEQSLSVLVREQEWQERVERVRQALRAKSKEFESRKARNKSNPEDRQKSEGDVEIIGKQRPGSQGWNGWNDNEEEPQDQQRIVIDDDDEDIQIDDD